MNYTQLFNAMRKQAGAGSSDTAAAEQYDKAMQQVRDSLLTNPGRRLFDTRTKPLSDERDALSRAMALDAATKDQLLYGGGSGLAATGLTYAGLGSLDYMKQHPGLRLLLSGLAGVTTGSAVGNMVGNRSYAARHRAPVVVG